MSSLARKIRSEFLSFGKDNFDSHLWEKFLSSCYLHEGYDRTIVNTYDDHESIMNIFDLTYAKFKFIECLFGRFKNNANTAWAFKTDH